MEDFYMRFKQDIEMVKQECAKVINSFYEPFIPYLESESSILNIQVQYDMIVDYITLKVKYQNLPFLFKTLFRELSQEQMINIAVASQLYAESIVTLDQLMDGHIKPTNVKYHLALLAQHHRLQHALILFQRDFEPLSPFWTYMQQYCHEHANAILLEKTKHQNILTPYTESEMEEIAKGKPAMAKIVVIALSLLSRNIDTGVIITESLDEYAIGRQLYDDIIDWKEDYLAKRYSYPLTIMLENTEVDKLESQMATTQLGRKLYYSGLVERFLDKADNYFERAIRKIENLDCSDWIDYIRKTQMAAKGMRKDLMEIKNWLIEKSLVVKASRRSTSNARACTSVEINEDNLQRTITKAIHFLLHQQKKGYPEARYLEFAREKTHAEVEGNCQWGDTFSRALILDTLLEIQLAGLLNKRDIIEQEIDKIIATKLTRARTGWSYFPSITKLPADADNLGHVLRVLVKANFKKIRDVCEEPVQLLVNHNSHPNGVLDTWIADPHDLHSIAMKQNIKIYRRIKSDVEVMANVLYGIYLYDQQRFGDLINYGVQHLIECQDDSGYWSNSIYCSKYYATYVCFRMIASVKPVAPCLVRTMKYMNAAQNKDGGWGEVKSTPTETALALLTILSAPISSRYIDCAERGIRFLLSCQGEGGNWSPSNLIKVDIFRMLFKPKRSTKGELLLQSSTFASSTVSTSYCLMALIQAKKYLARLI